MWIDKKRFHDLIVEYQNLNDDLDAEWLKFKVFKPRGMTDDAFDDYVANRKTFRTEKEKWYAEKKERIENETEEERKARNQRLDLVGDELFGMFYEIIESVLSGFGFHNLFADEYYFDIKQEIVERLLTIVNRFDTKRENPLAYFIQVIKNLAYNARGNEFAHRYKFLTNSFLETHEIKEDKNVVKEKPKPKKEKSSVNPFEQFMEK